MNLRHVGVRTIAVSAIAGMAAFFAGCSKTENISEEFARISSQEVSNMDANSSGMIAQGAAAKRANIYSDTISYDLILHPYSWDSVNLCYVRTVKLFCRDGFRRVRVDTVTFFGAQGKLQYPTLAAVDSIHHVRHVKRDQGGNELHITLDMHSVVSALSGQTGNYTNVDNGSIAGTFDGEHAVTGTISNVIRDYVSGRWQLFPQSGSITVDFSRRSYEVDYLGNGEAKLTITNKSTDKTREITIDVDQQ